MIKASFTRLSFGLLPGRCLCCDLPSQRLLDLCSGCEHSLPAPVHQCPRCAIPVPLPALCGQCLQRTPPFSRALIPWLYAPPLDELILRLKAGGQLVAGQVLGQLLADYLAARAADPAFIRPDLIVPVPLHWRRQLRRGFNQSRELALPVSQRLGIPVAPRTLKRVLAIQQHGRGRRQRLQNMAGAFVASHSLKGKNIALIDDVMTTGATLTAAATALLRAGARDVQVWCLARRIRENAGKKPEASP